MSPTPTDADLMEFWIGHRAPTRLQMLAALPRILAALLREAATGRPWRPTPAQGARIDAIEARRPGRRA